MSAPWTAKYRPKNLADVAGNKETIEKVTSWLKGWEKKPPKKRGLLLHGPPGTGKTVIAEAAARDLDYDLIEVNASDKRNRESLERIVGSATQQGGLFGRKRLILLDEVDGVNASEDRGAVDSIVKILSESHYPVILTANDAWERKISALRNACELVALKRLGVRDSLPYLKKVAAGEGLAVDDQAIRALYDKNRGDMRSMINDLQSLSAGRKSLTFDDVQLLGYRDRRDSIFEALAAVFNSREAWRAKQAVDMADVDFEMFFEWVYENTPRQITDVGDLANAMEALSKADLYMAHIKRKQDWRFLSFFIDLMTAGVATSRTKPHKGWTPMRFPERIQGMARTRAMRAVRAKVAAALASKCHISSRRAITEYIPYLRAVFNANPENAASIAKWLELDEDSIGLLSGSEDNAAEIQELLER